MNPKIYLAGPDVFFPDAKEIFALKKSLCEKYGFVGIAPLDNEIELDPKNPSGTARQIYLANKKCMDAADICIANITPFRGVSADPGTVFEVGYMCGIGKRVHGYSCNTMNYADRVVDSDWKGETRQVDRKGDVIESFGMTENLMIPCGIIESGGEIVTIAGSKTQDNLEAFEQVLSLIYEKQALRPVTVEA